MERAFHKFQAIGNDYILFDAVDSSLALSQQEVTLLCDRRFGVGADGILIVTRDPSVEGFNMEIINSDGSLAMMCGNGLRSTLKYLVDAGYAREGAHVNVSTRSGLRGGTVLSTAGRTSQIKANVGKPKIVDPERQLGETSFALVDVGNMHAVHFLAHGDLTERALGEGPTVEHAVEGGINVGYFSPSGPSSMALTVWERGAGFTQACGTGATAAGFYALQTGLFPKGTALTVTQPGGNLGLTVNEAGEAWLTGEAECVFSGTRRHHG